MVGFYFPLPLLCCFPTHEVLLWKMVLIRTVFWILGSRMIEMDERVCMLRYLSFSQTKTWRQEVNSIWKANKQMGSYLLKHCVIFSEGYNPCWFMQIFFKGIKSSLCIIKWEYMPSTKLSREKPALLGGKSLQLSNQLLIALIVSFFICIL